MRYHQSFERLQAILMELREKCPWDRKQTIQSLKPQTIEEVYELADAILEGDWQALKEELGDLLLHILFYSRIAEEEAEFNIGDVIEAVCNKLVYRHPHIYASVQVENEEEVKQNWEQLKLKEGKKSVLSGVAGSLPAMTKSLVIQRKVKQIGFEWDQVKEVKAKVEEEWQELNDALQTQDQQQIEEEFGDLFFSMINYARFLKIDPEDALNRTNDKFKNRFQQMERFANEEHRLLKEMTLEEMDILWERAKREGFNT